MKLISNFIAATILLTSSLAFAEIVIVKNDGGKIVDVSGDVKAACGNNFLYREDHKKEAPKYLSGEIIKAAFTGKMQPSFDVLKNTLKSSSGKCAWITKEERGNL